jgi:hypothetical protein
MDEFLVETILKKDKVTSKIFLEAYARDELPSQPPFPSCFIINTDPRSKPGAHWLAVYYNERGYCDFFDSYGQPPDYFNLEKYINKTSRGWSFNRKRIQGDSDLCGVYAILFLIFRARDQLPIFYKQFSNNYSKNDKVIMDYLTNYKHKSL